MQAIPLVRTSSVRPLLDFVDRLGARPGPALSGARALLTDPSALIPVSIGGALWAEAERTLGDEAIGLRAGADTRVLELGDWGAVLARAPTVAALLEATITTSRRFNTGQCFWTVRRGDQVWLYHRFTSRLTQGRHRATEFALSMVLQAIRLATGSAWRPSELHLEAPPPGHAEELAALADRIFFGQPGTALVFPASVLAVRNPPRAVARRHGSASDPAEDFEGSVRQTVASLVRLGAAELSVAAEAACMSERTFQRRLAASGIHFKRLVDEARFESACRMLSNPAVKIVEISAQLGYTDSANFTRAFRRWAGVAPDAFRRTA